ncbi:divergent polysaccharide deacetylase family protein [candidate division KSB1 bacterium]|nr:divergent polysaccharide deacetylase family protein [candidate division KSB1 bacterium]
MPRKRRSYKPRSKPTKRRTTRDTIKRHRKHSDNKFLDASSKAIRFIVLIAICAFIMYRLFIYKKSSEPAKTPQDATPSAVDTAVLEPVEKKVSLDGLSKDKALDLVVKQLFKEFNLDDSWIKRKGNIITVQLPSNLPAVTLIWEIIQKTEDLDLKVINSEEDLKANKSSISIGTKNETLLTIHFIKNATLERKTGKVAIIIDDFGYYDNSTTAKFLELEFPVTLSIIPGQKYSAKIAQDAKQFNKTVMIHLPMEALEEKVENGDYTITTTMPDSVIARRIQQAISAIPEAVGVNNHMGSKATADSRVMNIVMKTLKPKGKFFVDSRTTGKSVAKAIAHDHTLKFASNDGFLERNRHEEEQYIRRKLAAIAKIAKRRGSAIVIGHPYKQTLAVLAEELPKLEKQGFQIVPITDVVR